MENFNSLLKFFNILKSSIQMHKIQHFHKCIHILSIFLCSLSIPGFAPTVLLYVYTQRSILKAAKLAVPQGLSESKKMCDVFKVRWGGGLQKNVHMTFLVDKIDM